MAPLWFSFQLRFPDNLAQTSSAFPNTVAYIALRAMYSCAQSQLLLSFPVSARSTLGQQGSKSVSKSTYSPQLARRATPAGNIPAGRNRRYTTTSSAVPVGEIALLPSLFPLVLRAFSAGLLLYSSLRWASARSDRQQASCYVMLEIMWGSFEARSVEVTVYRFTG